MKLKWTHADFPNQNRIILGLSDEPIRIQPRTHTQTKRFQHCTQSSKLFEFRVKIVGSIH